MKSGLIKKEKSQKHIVEKKKDILKNNNSLMFQEGENEEMYLSPKHKTKVNRKINFIEAHNMKQRNSKTSLNNNFFQSQNLINLINEKSSVQNSIFLQFSNSPNISPFKSKRIAVGISFTHLPYI